MSPLHCGKFLGAVFVLATVASACGSVDEGRINIVDEDAEGGAGGSGGTRDPGGGGKSNGGSGAGMGGEVGGGAGEGPVPVLPDPPVVVSISPSVGESEAEPTSTISIEFSEGLDPKTVTRNNIIVYDGETRVRGTLEYSGVTAEFTPDARLDLLGEYSVVVTTGIKDADGTALEEDFSSSFTVRDGEWSEQLLVETPTSFLNRRLVSPAIDGQGNALVVWGQAKAGETAVSVFGRYFSPGEGFGDPFEIDDTTVDCDDISVAMNAAGEAIVAWTENHSNLEQVWARRLSQGSLKGTAPARVDVTAVAQVSGTTSAVSATGEAHVLWSFNSATSKQNLLASHAELDGDWLSTPQGLYDYAATLSSPGVAFDADGNGFVFFAFQMDSTTPGELYARRYLAKSGQWGNGVTILGSDDLDLYQAPSVVTDAEGGARAIFGAGPDVRVATFTKAGGFDAAVAIDALNSSPQPLPQLSSNGTQFLATWYQSASLNRNAYSALSEGGSFAAPELRSSGDFQVGHYGTSVSGMDRRGNALVLFEQSNATSSVDIVFARLTGSNGEWSEGFPVNTLAGNYQDPRIVVAPNGVGVAVWSVGIRLSANSIFVSTFE